LPGAAASGPRPAQARLDPVDKSNPVAPADPMDKPSPEGEASPVDVTPTPRPARGPMAALRPDRSARPRPTLREADLYAPVKAYLEAQGYVVKAEIGDCDLLARRGAEPPLVVELKLTFFTGAGDAGHGPPDVV